MTPLGKYLLLSTCAALASCASGPPKENAVKSKVYDLSNAGMIVGRITSGGRFGTGVTFKAVATGLTFTYTGAADFSMWLPEGEYEISGIGSTAGSLGPFKRPLTFRAEKGRVAYVGTISYGCRRPSPAKVWYGLQNCGLLALGECTVAAADIPMCVFDDQREVMGSFQAQHPELASVPVTSAVMK
jgi:hypothetical protein